MKPIYELHPDTSNIPHGVWYELFTTPPGLGAPVLMIYSVLVV